MYIKDIRAEEIDPM